MSASVCLKVFHIIYKLSLRDMGKAAPPTLSPRKLCMFSYKCFLVILSRTIFKEIKITNIHER